MENVVELQGLANYIERAIAEVNRGAWNARNNLGIIVDLPSEIQVTVTLVDETQWAKLRDSSSNSTSTRTTQTGTIIEDRATTGDSTTARDSTSDQDEDSTTKTTGTQDSNQTMAANLAHNSRGTVSYTSTGD